MRRTAAVLVLVLAAGACRTTVDRTASATLDVVASTSAWGSLAAALGGPRVHVTTIVSNPNADPHDYEPTAADARELALASFVIVNGVGYDEWARRILDADETDDASVLDVGRLVGAGENDNPHRWYFPDDVHRVVDAITAGYQRVDPEHADAYDELHRAFAAGPLSSYDAAIDEIRASARGGQVPVGVTESLFDGVAAATGLAIATPRAFVTAVTEGIDPSLQDIETVGGQVATRSIRVLVVNPQNETADVSRLTDAAMARGIPVVRFTETMVGPTFVEWQVAQLRALRDALAVP